jgi:hypothetical protein
MLHNPSINNPQQTAPNIAVAYRHSPNSQVLKQIEGLKNEPDLLAAQPRALIIIRWIYIYPVELVFTFSEPIEHTRDRKERGLPHPKGPVTAMNSPSLT